MAFGVLASALTAFAIVGGSKAESNRYPWIVQIRVEGDLCAGSLIRPRWIVTTAHCVTDEKTRKPVEGSRLTARVGNNELDKGGELRTIDWAIPYPGYNGSQSIDLALARLDQEVSTTDPVRLVGLARGTLIGPGDRPSIAGWGMRGRRTLLPPKASPSLRQAQVRLAPSVICERERDAEWPFEPATQLCTTAGSGEVCHGDSGGPLFVDRGDGTESLIGVTQGGNRYCAPGHGNRFARLTGGPMREWLDAQLYAIGRPLSRCRDQVIRHGFEMHTIKRLRSNTGCSTGGAIAIDVAERDECVEETSGGTNFCRSGDFICGTEIVNGPAGVAFVSACQDGTRRITFRQGSASFSRGAPYRLRFDSRGFPAAVGRFDIAGGDRSISDMIDAFGQPDSTGGDATACTITWSALGLTAHAVDYGASEACDPTQGLINAITMRSPRFLTDRGAIVGISRGELQERHPEATTRGMPGDAYFDGEPAFGQGDLYVLHTFASPIGLGGRLATLTALVSDDAVVGFQVTPLLGGD
ncbi:MAG TPA: serine protease [Solirubrobacterales bacterium]|nr:serine protease [Solirubrobacterales bacterium]